MSFHSEYGQDAWLEENVFKGKRCGTFFEAGALDGVLHSNTLFFERERGWKGVLLEPLPVLFPMAFYNRPNSECFPVALADHAGIEDFEQIDNAWGWAGLCAAIEARHRARIDQGVPASQRRIIRVPCMKLADVLTRAELIDIDYLSLDLEGAEFQVLSVFPFERFNIDVLQVEDNFGRPELGQLIIGAGFEQLARIGPDDIYRRRK